MLDKHDEDVIVRDTERHRITGVPRSTWQRLEEAGQAPERVPLTDSGLIGWLKSELLAWVQERAARRGASPAMRENGKLVDKANAA